MTALDRFLRLGRWQLDERRRHLADLEALAARLGEAGARLEAGKGVDPQTLLARREHLEHSLDQVAQEIALARDALAESIREVRRLDAAVAARAVKERRRVARLAADIVPLAKLHGRVAKR